MGRNSDRETRQRRISNESDPSLCSTLVNISGLGCKISRKEIERYAEERSMWSTQFKKNGENVRDTVKTVIEYYCNEKFGFNVEVFYSITGNRDFYYILFNSTDEDIVSYEDDGEEYYFERPDIIVDKSYKSFKRWLSETFGVSPKEISFRISWIL